MKEIRMLIFGALGHYLNSDNVQLLGLLICILCIGRYFSSYGSYVSNEIFFLHNNTAVWPVSIS